MEKPDRPLHWMHRIWDASPKPKLQTLFNPTWRILNEKTRRLKLESVCDRVTSASGCTSFCASELLVLPALFPCHAGGNVSTSSVSMFVRQAEAPAIAKPKCRHDGAGVAPGSRTHAAAGVWILGRAGRGIRAPFSLDDFLVLSPCVRVLGPVESTRSRGGSGEAPQGCKHTRAKQAPKAALNTAKSQTLNPKLVW